MQATLHDAPVISPEPAVLTPGQIAANRERTWTEFVRLAAEWDRRPAS